MPLLTGCSRRTTPPDLNPCGKSTGKIGRLPDEARLGDCDEVVMKDRLYSQSGGGTSVARARSARHPLVSLEDGDARLPQGDSARLDARPMARRIQFRHRHPVPTVEVGPFDTTVSKEVEARADALFDGTRESVRRRAHEPRRQFLDAPGRMS
jgi:hypothetical protein